MRVDEDGKIISHATLIIMPDTLVSQWKGEVRKHFTGQFKGYDFKHIDTDIDANADLITNGNIDNNTALSSSNGIMEETNIPDDTEYPTNKNEINKPALRVLVYEGCDELSLNRAGLTFRDVDPRYLSTQYDIIFMSLKTLTKEFHQSRVEDDVIRTPRERGVRGSAATTATTPVGGGVNNGDNGWGGKMYISYPPPMMCIRFAMIVVDETQKIESEGVSQSLSLCTRISSDCRLCVTGTPLGHNRLSDLHSLCHFLHIQPYGFLGKREWLCVFGEKSLLGNEKIRNKWLCDMFSNVMLRRTKNVLLEQLRLLPTVVAIRTIHFSGFEVRTVLFSSVLYLRRYEYATVVFYNSVDELHNRKVLQ